MHKADLPRLPDMKTYVINLDRDADRLGHVQGQMARAGIAFERMSAVVGLAVPHHLTPKFLTPAGESASILTAGEIGCYASHLRVYEAMVERNEPCALVLEDDICVDPQLKALLPEIIDALPQGWDIVKLCNNPTRPVSRVAPLIDLHYLVRFSEQPVLTAGYLISQHGARKMLASGLRAWPIDIDMMRPWQWGLDVYGVCPAPVTPLTTFGSSVMGSQADTRNDRHVPHDRLQAAIYRIRTMGILKSLKCGLVRMAERNAKSVRRRWRMLIRQA